MVSEMIERVVKSMDAAAGAFLDNHAGCVWEDIPLDVFARAAIEAMLEPTDEMVEAAVSEFTFHATRPWPGTTPQSIQKDVFRRAIEAALDQEEA